MTSTLFGILEIAGHYRGKDARRKITALQCLRTATINGHDILTVIDTEQGVEPTTVDHYGYDYRCEGGCNHEPLPWGVKRYFGIHLVVSGDWDMLTYPLLYWVNPNAQIAVVGKALPHDGPRNALQEAEAA